MEDSEMAEAKRELVAMAKAQAEAEAAAAAEAATSTSPAGAPTASSADDESSSSDEDDSALPSQMQFHNSFYRKKPTVGQWDAQWKEQRECALLLLKARMLLRKMVETKLYEQRLNRGALSALEVHNLIRSQQEGDDTDFVTEITELKRNLMTDIRRNHLLEKEVGGLDKRIGLLIHNVGSMATHPVTPKPKKGAEKGAPENLLTPTKLQIYSHLFYLLQTEPKYLARLVGCIADTEGVDALLDTILLTMYGDAFSPREEFLILTLFKLAIEQEMKHITSISDFVKEQSVLAKMVLTYNRRKQGLEYMRGTLGPVMTEFLHIDASLELNARKIHQKIITDQETLSGVKSMARALTDEEILALPEVSAVVNKRVEQLQQACGMFLEKIVGAVKRLPYGLRWICKQHRAIAQDAVPNAKPDDLNKMTSYFVYYRFINLGVVSPETFNIVETKLTPQSVFNLVEVSKVLHHLFNFTPFDSRTEKWYVPMNQWMADRTDMIRQYIRDLLDVENPEDALQVDRYIELTQMVKPTILIGVNEMTSMHRFIVDNAEKIAPGGPEDKLRVILRELGPVEAYSDGDREIQITLVNRFPATVDEAMSDGNQLFHQTKTALISVMRQLPKPLPVIRTAGDEPTLGELLRAGAKWAKSENNEPVRAAIEKVRHNIEELEKIGLVSADDGHRALLKAVTLEIANRAQIREQQNKELARLHLALKKAAEQQRYLNEQISQYNQYLHVVRERHVGVGGGKKKSKSRAKAQDGGKIMGPFKFSYMELVKKRVIVESEVPKPLQKATKISITSEEPGVFDVEVRIPGLAAETIQIFLDDLLEKQSRNQEHDERTNITLDINMTIFLLNKLFKKK